MATHALIVVNERAALGPPLGDRADTPQAHRGTCLLLVVTLVIFGAQVFVALPWPLTVALMAGAALFARQAFRTRIRLGWI